MKVGRSRRKSSLRDKDLTEKREIEATPSHAITGVHLRRTTNLVNVNDEGKKSIKDNLKNEDVTFTSLGIDNASGRDRRLKYMF